VACGASVAVMVVAAPGTGESPTVTPSAYSWRPSRLAMGVREDRSCTVRPEIGAPEVLVTDPETSTGVPGVT
jgi:hypothetical protein